MFKKITSNRDPDATVFSELRKEFNPWFAKSGKALRRTIENYPRFLFAMMVINLLLSAVLVMTVFRPAQNQRPVINVVAPVSGGFDRIMQAGEALRQTISLKKQVDSLIKCKTLSKADSMQLISDLDSLRHITLPINPNRHEH